MSLTIVETLKSIKSKIYNYDTMNTKKKGNQTSARNLIISSIVWASVIIACAYNSDGSNKQITYILLSGFLVEFLRMSSQNKPLKNTKKENQN
jgi:hypothetical protein